MNPRRLRMPVSASVAAAAEIATNSRSRRRARRLERSASAAKASAIAKAAPRAIHTAVGITFTTSVTTLVIGAGMTELPDEECLGLLCAVVVPVWAAAVPVGAADAGVPPVAAA